MPKRQHSFLMRQGNCRGIGILWITLGLTTLAQGEQFRLLQLNFASYPQLSQIATWLFAIFAVIQGYWFARKRGFVPVVGSLFFLFLTIYLGSRVTQRIDAQIESTDWPTLFLLILTILSLLGCRSSQRIYDQSNR